MLMSKRSPRINAAHLRLTNSNVNNALSAVGLRMEPNCMPLLDHEPHKPTAYFLKMAWEVHMQLAKLALLCVRPLQGILRSASKMTRQLQS